MIAAKGQMLISCDHKIAYNRKHDLLAGGTIEDLGVLHHGSDSREIKKWLTALEFKGDPGIW